MKLRTKDGSSPSINIGKDKWIDFRGGIADVPDKQGIEMSSFGSNYEVIENKLFPFNPDSWEKHKRVYYETSIAPANGFGKAGSYITKGLSEFADVYIIDPFARSWGDRAVPECVEMATKDADIIDGYYIQSKVIGGLMGHRRSEKMIIRTMFETNKIKREWAEYMNEASIAVLVPCKTQKEVFEKSGVTVPVYILPDAIDVDAYPEAPRHKRDSFVFGMEGTLTYRKGADLGIKAFQKAFPKDKYPNVFLIVKTRTEGSLPFGESQRLVNGRIILNEDDRIVVLNEEYTHDELIKNFYHELDAYLFLSRGEGFSMTTAQAMVMGIPIVGSSCSGVKEQLQNGRGYLVDTTLVPVPDGLMYQRGKLVPVEGRLGNAGYDSSSQVEGHQWWEADIDDAVSKIKLLYNNYSEAEKRAKKAQAFAKRHYSSKAVGKKLFNIIEKIHANSK